MPQGQSIPPQPEEQTVETIDHSLREIAREGARSLLQLSANRSGSPDAPWKPKSRNTSNGTPNCSRRTAEKPWFATATHLNVPS